MYHVIDNFLETEKFQAIQTTMTEPNFSWFFQPYIANHNETKGYPGVFLAHMFYNNCLPNSPYFEMIYSLLNKIDIKALIRVKANLYPSLEKIYTHEMHVDHNFPHKGAIFHLNTNNGHTILSDGTKLESVENRIVFFDSSISHASTTCNDQPFRMNININYF